jgi:hypothetical protein
LEGRRSTRLRLDSIAKAITPDAERRVDWTKVSTDTFGLVGRVHRDGEDVAGTALDSDIARPRRIAYDLAAQAADLDVD